ncbi:MAG: RraA family protein, partial [Candidatus Acidiferrales bacterium]
MNSEPLPPACLEQLRTLSGCVVASAIEPFGVRLRNKGFTDSRLRCIFDDLPPIVGYAVTARIRTSDPPMEGHSFYDHRDWWDSLLTTPAPRVVVIEDMDKEPGLGAFIGEVHANILRALGCVGLVTNGAVRDLPQVNRINFQMFAGNVSLSHAYSHVFDFGRTVEIAGLAVRPGDLIHGDLHGVQTVPLEIAQDVPARALKILERRQNLISYCKSDAFSLPNLR